MTLEWRQKRPRSDYLLISVQGSKKAFFVELIEDREVDEAARIGGFSPRELVHAFENRLHAVDRGPRGMRSMFFACKA